MNLLRLSESIPEAQVRTMSHLWRRHSRLLERVLDPHVPQPKELKHDPNPLTGYTVDRIGVTSPADAHDIISFDSTLTLKSSHPVGGVELDLLQWFCGHFSAPIAFLIGSRGTGKTTALHYCLRTLLPSLQTDPCIDWIAVDFNDSTVSVNAEDIGRAIALAVRTQLPESMQIAFSPSTLSPYTQADLIIRLNRLADHATQQGRTLHLVFDNTDHLSGPSLVTLLHYARSLTAHSDSKALLSMRRSTFNYSLSESNTRGRLPALTIAAPPPRLTSLLQTRLAAILFGDSPETPADRSFGPPELPLESGATIPCGSHRALLDLIFDRIGREVLDTYIPQCVTDHDIRSAIVLLRRALMSNSYEVLNDLNPRPPRPGSRHAERRSAFLLHCMLNNAGTYSRSRSAMSGQYYNIPNLFSPRYADNSSDLITIQFQCLMITSRSASPVSADYLVSCISRLYDLSPKVSSRIVSGLVDDRLLESMDHDHNPEQMHTFQLSHIGSGLLSSTSLLRGYISNCLFDTPLPLNEWGGDPHDQMGLLSALSVFVDRTLSEDLAIIASLPEDFLLMYDLGGLASPAPGEHAASRSMVQPPFLLLHLFSSLEWWLRDISHEAVRKPGHRDRAQALLDKLHSARDKLVAAATVRYKAFGVSADASEAYSRDAIVLPYESRISVSRKRRLDPGEHAHVTVSLESTPDVNRLWHLVSRQLKVRLWLYNTPMQHGSHIDCCTISPTSTHCSFGITNTSSDPVDVAGVLSAEHDGLVLTEHTFQ